MVAALLLCVIGVLATCDALRLPALGTRRLRLPFAVASTAVSSEAAVDNQVSGLNVEDLFVDSPTEVHDKLLKAADGSAAVPAWLNGALIRNGPGLFGADKRRFDHIFDGVAKLTRYNFVGDGTVRYSTRFLRSNVYEAVKNGDIPPGPYTGPVNPPFSRWQKVKGAVTSMSTFDNVPVNVHQLGDERGPWVGTTDAPVQVHLLQPIFLGSFSAPDLSPPSPLSVG
jgi:hypothetical protein